MNDWKTVRLGDVCEIVNGFAFDSKLFNTDKKGIPLIRIRDVIRGFSETYTTENADSRFLVKVGDLLIGMDGEFNCSLWKSEDSFLNQRVCKIVPNLELINKDYVYYGLKGKLKEIEDKTSFVTVKHISSKQIDNIVLKYPPLETQKQIAVQLDKCTALIAKQKQILEKYDTLIKSKFEMAIYEKLWYNYQIWRKKMGLFRGILDLFSTWTISDKFGLGAGFLYADYAWEKANERELNKMKAGVTQTISNYINENRKLLNNDLIQTLNNYINSIANCNKFNANSILSELKNFVMHKCAYHSCIIEILNHSIEAIESIPEDNLDDGVKIQALQKTKNVINCSDSNQLPILLKDLFSFYDENGIEVENKEELFDKFESLRKEYLA